VEVSLTDPNSVYSFEEIYRKHRGVVHGAILRTSHGSVRQQDIGDLEQEVWARVWQTMQPGSGSAYNPARGASVTSWLFMVTRSVCCNRFVRNTRDPMNLAMRLDLQPQPRTRPQPWLVSVTAVPSLRDGQFERRVMGTSTPLARYWLQRVRDLFTTLGAA
jgi:DNA-directed RNA polymerase specialized sigma24 family protein